MSKKYLLYIILLLFIFITKIVFAQNEDFTLQIKASSNIKTANESYQNKMLFIKEGSSTDEEFYKEFTLYKDNFLKDYSEKEKLLNASSTIQQAYDHSLNMFECCINHTNKFNNLKEKALLTLLQGKWIGNIDIIYLIQQKNILFTVKTRLEGSFMSDSSGLISQGYLKGYRYIHNNNNLKTEKYPVDANLNGYIIPLALNSIDLSIEDNHIQKKNFKNINYVKITPANILNIPSFIDSQKINTSLSFTVCNLKIYYNLLANSTTNIKYLMNYKYNYIFNELLNLVALSNNKVVSSELLKSLGLVPKSKLLSEGFINYFNLRSSYYNQYLYNIKSNIKAIEIYKNYLNELIDLTAITYTGIIDINTIKEVNLDIDNPNNKINSVFINYYKLLLKLKKEYSNDNKHKIENITVNNELQNLNKLAKTGIIGKKTLFLIQ